MAVISLQNGAWSAGFAGSDLNALAHSGQKTSSLASPHVDNATAGATYAQVEIALGALSPTVGGVVIVVFIPETTVAGTYMTGEDGTTGNDQYRWMNYPHAVLALRLTASSAQIQRSGLIQIAAERYRLAVINRAGVALAATGNSVSWRLVTENVT